LIYVLASTPQPGVVKVGKTTRSARTRAEELALAPGYREFAPYRVVGSWRVPDCDAVETAALRRLKRHRVRLRWASCQELFRVSEAVACQAVQAAARNPYPYPSWLLWLVGAAAAAVLLLVLLLNL